MSRSFSQEARSDSHKIGETRYRMSHLPSTTAIARTLLLAGILLAVAVLAARSFFPAFAQDAGGARVLETVRIDFEENSTGSVAVFTATDPEGEDVVWSLLAGADSGKFSIDGGALTFDDAPDFEATPDDVDGSFTDADGETVQRSWQPYLLGHCGCQCWRRKCCHHDPSACSGHCDRHGRGWHSNT